MEIAAGASWAGETEGADPPGEPGGPSGWPFVYAGGVFVNQEEREISALASFLSRKPVRRALFNVSSACPPSSGGGIWVGTYQ